MKPLEFHPPANLEIARDRVLTSLLALSNLATQKKVPPENRVMLDVEIYILRDRVYAACDNKNKFNVQETMRPLCALRILDTNGKSIDINISRQMEDLEKNLNDMQKLLK